MGKHSYHKTKNIAAYIILMVCAVIIIFMAILIAKESAETLSAGNYYVRIKAEGRAGNKDEKNEELLSDIHDNYVGLVTIPGTNIDYPIMQAQDNEYYLSHLPDDTENKNGSIFLDCNNSSSLTDAKIILYGHNMKSGAMFHDLKKYADKEYTDEHQVLYLTSSSYENKEYVFLCTGIATDADPDVYSITGTKNLLTAFSKIGDPEAINGYNGGKLLFLSTCEKGINRRVVVFQEVLNNSQY